MCRRSTASSVARSAPRFSVVCGCEHRGSGVGDRTLVLVLVLCLAGVTAVSMQVRCIDAAREAARLAARGDVRSATDVARSIAPRAALVQVHRDGEFVVATVTAHSNLLPTLDIAARAISVAEPG